MDNPINSNVIDFCAVKPRRLAESIETIFFDGLSVETKATDRAMPSDGYLAAFEATYHDIVAIFGEPSSGDNYKTEAQWRVLMPENQAVTIYNYKTSKSCNPQNPDINEVTLWHIGGKNRQLVDNVIALMAGKATITHKHVPD